MDYENKIKTTLWLHPSIIEKADSVMKLAKCHSRSELMEDALQFYCGYVQSKDASKYLSPVIAETIREVMENNDNRIRSLLFKLAVELNMACHTIAAHFRVDDIDRRALRAFAVDEVKKTNGQVSFDHALDVQRRIPVKDDQKWPG